MSLQANCFFLICHFILSIISQTRMALAKQLKDEKDAKDGKSNAKKDKPVEKSLVVLEVKPWEADTNLEEVRARTYILFISFGVSFFSFIYFFSFYVFFLSQFSHFSIFNHSYRSGN